MRSAHNTAPPVHVSHTLLTRRCIRHPPNGRILAETSKAGDDMVIADLDGSLVALSVGQAFLKVRRPDLYRSLVEKTGREEGTRSLKIKE